MPVAKESMLWSSCSVEMVTLAALGPLASKLRKPVSECGVSELNNNPIAARPSKGRSKTQVGPGMRGNHHAER